jgi:hypothetical protein
MSKSTRSIRIPDELYEAVARMAAREERTTSNMIIVLLKEAVKKRGEEGKAGDV